MRPVRTLIAIPIAAMAITTAADAHRKPYRHHHEDKFDVGDAIVGAAIVGGLIAILSSGKDKDERRADPPAPPAPYPADDDYPPAPDWNDRPGGYDRGQDYGYADPDYERRFPSERAAVDACSEEAEALGGRYGADARLSRIFDVDAYEREYRVSGEVRIDDRRSSRIHTAGFTCFADGGDVTGFRFEEQVAYRD
ncbi:hypothetical protein B5C34_07860 [Pacificimonas flava]|uniref:Uncharacterized protein n=2 Tax=Pacificimonas TaxID=1960290 RepID=A0A219B5F3_9SPHN|nr:MULTISPECIES: hypothetical protein [Pacificimonas]MBZ6379424.1 hypothetical protein [Pacificimonas aurantium]OWV33383.1 hypothetical protein B5C34_07860 [Pacificimonas flava]